MTSRKMAGSCLCGTVTYEYEGPVSVFQYCHCSRCRKFTGSAHASNILGEPAGFRWMSGEDALGRFELAGAKHFATSFCRTCGSAMPWLTQSRKAIVIPAGTLDNDPGSTPIHNIFTANRAPWYVPPESLRSYEGLPVKS